jgi:hypothetical protein
VKKKEGRPANSSEADGVVDLLMRLYMGDGLSLKAASKMVASILRATPMEIGAIKGKRPRDRLNWDPESVRRRYYKLRKRDSREWRRFESDMRGKKY